ncbi:MAG: response regulator transcription factor, partial [Chloroflexota bacterium]
MSSYEPRILLVEGKRAGSESLIHLLSKRWQHVDVVHSGTEAVAAAKFHRPNVIVLDTSTMRTTGVRICKRLQKEFPDLPMIHCRAEGESYNANLEVDIYLEKPFSQVKLNNRVYKLMPALDDESQIIQLGEFKLYLGKGAIDVPKKGEQPLTPKLTRLLELFMSNPNEVISRKQLMEDVWDTTYIGDTRTLDVHIRWIRQAIEETPAKPAVLTTVHSVGYIFNYDEKADAVE